MSNIIDLNAETTINDQLYKSLINENYEQAQELLTQGADINHTNLKKQNLFTLFLLKHKTDQAQWLMNQGADVNAVDNKGDTVLNKVFNNLDYEIIEWLHENCKDKVNPDIENKSGATPLINSLNMELINLYNWAMQFNPNIDYVNKNGNRALLTAASRKNNDSICLDLLKKGAEFENVVSYEKNNLLHLTGYYHLNQSFDYILGQCKKENKNNNAHQMIEAKNSRGETPLGFCCVSYNIQSIKSILDAGANPNVRTRARMEDGKYPIQVMTELMGILKDNKQKIETIQQMGMDDGSLNEQFNDMNKTYETVSGMLDKLLEQPNLDVDITTEKGRHLMFFAAQSLDINYFNQLVDKGMPLDVLDKEQSNPLFELVHNQRLDIIKQYFNEWPIEYWNEKLNVTIDQEGHTASLSPFNLMVQQNDLDMIDFVLNQGVESQDNMNFLSFSYDQQELAQTLNNGQISESDAEKKLNDYKNKKLEQLNSVIHKIVESGEDINALNEQGKTPLMLKASRGETEIVQALVDNGADLKTKDEAGFDVLYDSLLSSYPDQAYDLVKNNYDKQHGIESSILPELILASPEDKTRKNFIERLSTLSSDFNLDLNYQDEEGNSLLLLAVATDQEDMSDFLLNQNVNVNNPNNSNEVPILHAASQDNQSLVDQLLQKGADLTIQFNKNQTVGEVIQDNCSKEIKKIIDDYMPDQLNNGFKETDQKKTSRMKP